METARERLILDNRLFRVLEHFRLAKVDYAKNITRYTDINRDIVQGCLRELENYGFIEKFTNTSIKRTEAKLKRSAEVHKHHTYFQLTRSGITVLKSIDARSYLDYLGQECIDILGKRKMEEDQVQLYDKMIGMGLMDKDLKLTPLGREVLAHLRMRNK